MNTEKTSNPVGRPPKLTDLTVKKLEEAFAIDATVEEACFYADISRTTYYEWIKENPKLADRFDALRQRPVLTARQAVVRSLNNPDYAFRYLERKKKNEFAPRTELTGEEGAPIPILASLNALPSDNSNQENSQAAEADQGRSGRDISQQDNLDTAAADSSGPVGQDSDADLDSERVHAAPEARGDEGLSDNSEGPQLLQGSPVE